MPKLVVLSFANFVAGNQCSKIDAAGNNMGFLKLIGS